jgi:hypothetical protein
MRRMLTTVTGLSFLLAISLAWNAPAAAQQADAETKAKLDALKKQVDALQKKIESLQQQEKALVKEMERRAEEKDYYTKLQADIKGRLQRSTGSSGKSGWTVSAAGTTWHLDFGDNKDWLELAGKLNGKTVLVTGSATVTAVNNPGWLYSTSPYGSGIGGPIYPPSGGMPSGIVPSTTIGGSHPSWGFPGYGSVIYSLKVELLKAP